ncbi:MAG: ABC transporter permease [Deltaproteobacteria bacterium]|nr:MAG: ABC transporter permease [Deltaproteobacteria bacterium]
MKIFLFRISLSHLTEYPGRTLLGILGIALGTAVYLSISLAAAAALQSFQAGVTALSGKAQWRLQSPGAPLPESLFVKTRRLPEVKSAAPAVESVLEFAAPRQGPVLLLGIDLFSERPFRNFDFKTGSGLDREALEKFLTDPAAILVSEPLAAQKAIKTGDTLPVLVGPVRQTLKVAGIFRTPTGLYPLEGSMLLMDLAGAQELLDRVGRLDYIDLILHGDQAGAAASLTRELPPGVELARPGSQARQMEGMVSSYRLNLAVLSAIALFVGMFLIYQSVTLSVVRRRREIGLLRTLGMGRSQVLYLFLAEGLAAGGLGGLLGLGLGVILAKSALGMMTQNLSSLYTPVQAGEIAVRLPLLLQAWALAAAATLIAALFPALEAARIRVKAVWHREELEERVQSHAGVLFVLGLLALALAGVLVLLRFGSGPSLPSFAAAFLILLAFALFTPLAARTLGERGRPLLRRFLGPPGDLGCRYLSGSLSRSAVSIAALACALGMLIAVAVMIGSFRQTVNSWVTRSISGDIFFGPAVFSTAAYDHYLPPEIVPELRRDPDIEDLYLYRCVRLPFKDRFILAIGGSFEVLVKYGGLWFREGDTQEIMRAVGESGNSAGEEKSPPFVKGDLGGFFVTPKTFAQEPNHRRPETGDRRPSVVISEPLAETFGYKEGDILELPTPAGLQRLRIAGVFYDYRTDGPSVWMDIRQFRRFWPDTHLNAVRLYLKDKAKIPEVQARLQEKYGSRYRLLTMSHEDLRRGILRIFDETFALTYALEGVAVVVAVFGIITTFLVLIMERERELALLQAIGASQRQILSMVLVESGLAGFLSFLLGAACGSVLSLLLIYVINKQAFGWTIHLFWTPGIYWQTLVLVLALGLASGAYPAWRAMQPHLAAILKEE